MTVKYLYLVYYGLAQALIWWILISNKIARIRALGNY